jgi:nitroreductase
MASVSEMIHKRISTRAFLQTPVPEEKVRYILDVARFAPSGGNTQPWHCYVVAGEKKRALTESVLKAFAGGDGTSEYKMYPGKNDMSKEKYSVYMKRRRQLAYDMFGLMGVERSDKNGRLKALLDNYRFFGAPIGIIVTVDREVDINGWGHTGCFLQNVCLVAEEEGLATCLQEAWANFHFQLHNILNIPKDQKVWCGISLGYADKSKSVNTLRSEREEVDQFATFMGFGKL